MGSRKWVLAAWVSEGVWKGMEGGPVGCEEGEGEEREIGGR